MTQTLLWGLAWNQTEQRHSMSHYGHLVRSADPETSRKAAEAAVPMISDHERIILDTLARIGQGTKDEIAAACGLDAIQVSRRMHGLGDEGKQMVSIVGERKLPTGRNGSVFALVERKGDTL